MSDADEYLMLFLLVFKGEERAKAALETLRTLDREDKLEIDIEEAAVLVRNANGQLTSLDTDNRNFSMGNVGSAVVGFFGGLVAMITGVPEVTAANIRNSVAGGVNVDLGFSDEWLQQIGDQLKPGNSVLIAKVEVENIEALRSEFAKFEDSELIEIKLDAADQSRLQSLFGATDG